MTDNDIVKALECCIETSGVNCGKCPYCDNCVTDENTSLMMTDALDLINRLQADKESLIAGQETLQKYIKKQKAEIERLKEENNILSQNADTAFQNGLNEAQDLYAEQVKAEIKSEAYREFWERSKNEFHEYRKQYKEVANFDGAAAMLIAKRGIDNLLKELVGEESE